MIIIVTDIHQDYMADYLTDGLFELFGVGNAIEWPPKPSLHNGERRTFDCDFNWSWHGKTEPEVVQALRDGDVELLVIPTLRGRVPLMLSMWRPWLGRLSDRVVYVDGEDHDQDSLGVFTSMTGIEPAVYFKRELPLGASWARPLTFSYPERRIVPAGGLRNGVIYDVQIWPGEVGEVRERIGTQLRRDLGLGQALVTMHYEQRTRSHPDLYHRRAQRSLVAVAPAGAGYFTNRLFEVVADGCALVAEAPYREWVNPIRSARYYHGADEAVAQAEELLQNPIEAGALAATAQVELRLHHTTAIRAREVYEAVHGPQPYVPGQGHALKHGSR